MDYACLHMHSLNDMHVNDLLSTQAVVASSDADIRQLIEKCKQLETQMSLFHLYACDVTLLGM